MFKNLKKKDYYTVVTLILVTVVFGYYYGNSYARYKLWLKTYPLRAQLAASQSSCSADSPSWMLDVIKHKTRSENAPANQIAYITPTGRLHHCENGYMGKYPVLSDSITKDTRFRYASVTKLWTSDAALDLMKKNELQLDTTLASMLPEVVDPKDTRINEITVGDLLSHRGGFDRYSSFGQDMFSAEEPICPHQLSKLNNITLGFAPGEKMSYSNLGYCLLGEIIARQGKTNYEAFIKQRYHFSGTSLAFIANSQMSDEVNYNYVETGLTGVGNIFTAFNYKGLASAAGLSGNAVDLAKQVKQMIQKPAPNILSLDPDLSCDFSVLRDCYGYAMFPFQKSNDELMVYFRDGNLLGVSSLVVVSNQGDIVALLSNGTASDDLDSIKMLIYDYLRHH